MDLRIMRRTLTHEEAHGRYGTFAELERITGEYDDGTNQFAIEVVRDTYVLTRPTTIYECNISAKKRTPNVSFEQQRDVLRIVLGQIMGVDVRDPQIEMQLNALVPQSPKLPAKR